MEQLKITATLGSPFVTGGGYLTFDALLASVVFSLTGDVEQAHHHLPLRCVEGLYYASSAVYEPFSTGRMAIVQSMRPDDVWLDPIWLKKNKHGVVHTKFSNLPDNIMNPYRTFAAPTLTWYCEGDADRIRALLAHLPLIGKKRHCTVTHWEVEEGESDGIHGYDDEALRPVPVERWDGNRSTPVVDAAWRPAYWDASIRTACYVPTL
jgi:hypothetical protein